MHLSIILLVFGVIFLAELPDKSMFASIVLASRYRRSYVWLGAASAFLVHVIIAVSAGRLLALVPKDILSYIIGGLFFIGSMLLLFGSNEDESDEATKLSEEIKTGQPSPSFFKVYGTSFVVVFLGEWGDITQLATANYAAKYHNVLSVGIGATLALWAVAGLGVIVGQKITTKIPARNLQRFVGILLLVFAVLTIMRAI